MAIYDGDRRVGRLEMRNGCVSVRFDHTEERMWFWDVLEAIQYLSGRLSDARFGEE